ALRSDLRPTLFAESEGSILDAIEGFLNLAQKDLFTAAEAEGERLQILAGRQVHFIGQIVLVERHILRQRLLRLLEDFFTLLFEKLLEFLELRLVHESLSGELGSVAHRFGGSNQRTPSRSHLRLPPGPGLNAAPLCR